MSVYVRLLHGRDNPEQDMNDWGFAGPLLGPFEAIHVTYLTHFRCFPEGHPDDEIMLTFTNDCLTYDGKHYGDFEVVSG